MPLPPGIHYNIDEAVYRSDAAVSQSELKAWANDYTPKKQRYFDIGTAFEDLVQRPDDFNLTWYVHKGNPDRRGTDVKGLESDKEAQGFKGCLKLKEYQLISAMRDSAMADMQVAEAIQAAEHHQVAIVKVDEDGFRTKCLLDGLGKRYSDIKSTTHETHGLWWAHQFYKLGYHLQGASYKDMADQALGRNAVFEFVVVSKEPPHNCWVHELTMGEYLAGKDCYEKLVSLWKRHRWKREEVVGNVEVVCDA